MNEITESQRAVSFATVDDIVMPFIVPSLDLRGRVVRLGPVVDEILEKHAYPQPVAKLLGEALALTAMLGSALKINGRFILQTQTDGPVRMLVVNFTSPNKVRACAYFDKNNIASMIAAGRNDSAALLGRGHLAMTIDRGPERNQYQGLVALDGGSLEDAAHEYFLRSEQIPTRIRLAVAEELHLGEGGIHHGWRVGGIMVQFLPRLSDFHPGDLPESAGQNTVSADDSWAEGQALVSTVQDIELIDPTLSSERLVYRLFHESGVRVMPGIKMHAQCSCSRGNVQSMLKSFSQNDRANMVDEEGRISVICEFCGTNYSFDPDDIDID
jgi:molecular chaperone Hsp33